MEPTSRIATTCRVRGCTLVACARDDLPHSPHACVSYTVVLQLMLQLRTATVGAVEAIRAWFERQAKPGFAPFMWNGVDYFAKMRHDIDFLADSEALVSALGVDPEMLRHNPMMMPSNLTQRRKEMRRRGQLRPRGAANAAGAWQPPAAPTDSSSEQERLAAAELLLVQHEEDEEARLARPHTYSGAIGNAHTFGEAELMEMHRQRALTNEARATSQLQPLSYSQRMVPHDRDAYDRSYERGLRRRRDKALLPLSVDAARDLYLPNRGPPSSLLSTKERRRRKGKGGRSRSPARSAWEQANDHGRPATADAADVGYGFPGEGSYASDYYPDFGLVGGEVGASYNYVPGSSYTGPGSGVDPASLPVIDQDKLAAAFRAHVPASRSRKPRSRARGHGGSTAVRDARRGRRRGEAGPGRQRSGHSGSGSPTARSLEASPETTGVYYDGTPAPARIQVSQARVRSQQRRAAANAARRGVQPGAASPAYRTGLGPLHNEQARQAKTNGMMNHRRAPGIQVSHTGAVNTPTQPAGGVYGALDQQDVEPWNRPRPGGAIDRANAVMGEVAPPPGGASDPFQRVLGLRAAEVEALGDVTNPPAELVLTATTTMILLQQGSGVPPNLTWPAIRQELANTPSMAAKLDAFDAAAVAPFKLRALKPFLAAAKLQPGRAPVLPRVSHSLCRFIHSVLRAKRTSSKLAGAAVIHKLEEYISAFPIDHQADPVSGFPVASTPSPVARNTNDGPPAPPADNSDGGSGSPVADAAGGASVAKRSSKRKKKGRKRRPRRGTKSPSARRSRSHSRPRSPTALHQTAPGATSRRRRGGRGRGRNGLSSSSKGAAPGPPSTPPAPPPMAPPSDDEHDDDRGDEEQEVHVRFAETVETSAGRAEPLAPGRGPPPPPPAPPTAPDDDGESAAAAAEADAIAAMEELAAMEAQAARLEAEVAAAESAAAERRAQEQYLETQPVIAHRTVRLQDAEYLVVSASMHPDDASVVSLRTYDPRACAHKAGTVPVARACDVLGFPAPPTARAGRMELCDAVSLGFERLEVELQPDELFDTERVPPEQRPTSGSVMHGAVMTDAGVGFVHTYKRKAEHGYQYRCGFLVKMYVPDLGREFFTLLSVARLLEFSRSVKVRFKTYDQRFHAQILSHLQLVNHGGRQSSGPSHHLILVDAAVRRRSMVLGAHVETAAGYDVEDTQKQRAALTIQGSFRGRMARQRVSAMRRDRARVTQLHSTLDSIDEDEAETAATTLQCAARTRQARRRVAEKRRDRDVLAAEQSRLAEVAEEEGAHAAAVAIQCRVRQRGAKRQVAKKRNEQRLRKRRAAATRIANLKRSRSAHQELQRRKAAAKTAIGRAVMDPRPLVRAGRVLGGRAYVVSVTRLPKVGGSRGHNGGYLFKAESVMLGGAETKTLKMAPFEIVPSAQIAQVVGMREARGFQEIEDLKARVKQLALLRGRLVVADRPHDEHVIAVRLPVVYSDDMPSPSAVANVLDAAEAAEDGGVPPPERSTVISCWVDVSNVGDHATATQLATERFDALGVHLAVHDMESVTDSRLELEAGDTPELARARDPESAHQALADVSNDIVLWVQVRPPPALACGVRWCVLLLLCAHRVPHRVPLCQCESAEAEKKLVDANAPPKVRALYVPNSLALPVVATEVEADADGDAAYDRDNAVVLKGAYRVSGRSLLINVQRTPAGNFGIDATDAATGQSLCLSLLELEAQLASDDPEAFADGDVEAVKATLVKVVDVLLELVTADDGVAELRVLPMLPAPVRCSRAINGAYYVINVGAGGGGVYVVDVLEPRTGWTASLPVSSLSAGFSPQGRYEDEARRLCMERLAVVGEGEDRRLELSGS